MNNNNIYDTNGKHLKNDALIPIIERTIVLLDDHVLFRSGLIKSCIRPFFKNILLKEFADGDITLKFVKDELKMGRKIKLIISDINHPGTKGNDFVREVRTYEALYNNHCRIPILIISMVEPNCFPDLISNNIIDHYISKATDKTLIINYIRECL